MVTMYEVVHGSGRSKGANTSRDLSFFTTINFDSHGRYFPGSGNWLLHRG